MASSSSDSSGNNTLYVLYGSQMGNSEQAAKDFAKQFESKQSDDKFSDVFSGITPKAIQLDDYLEMHHAPVSKLPIVIFVSSYGVGQAPLGAYRFRELCEKFIDIHQTGNKQSSGILKGIQYAICGLGDSSYPTYLKNPATIDQGLTSAGAARLPNTTLGKADAQQSGDTAQDKIIQQWILKLWQPLHEAIKDVKSSSAAKVSDSDETNDDAVDYKQMQHNIIKLLIELDPDYTPPKGFGKSETCCGGGIMLFLSIAVCFVAIALGMGMYSKNADIEEGQV